MVQEGPVQKEEKEWSAQARAFHGTHPYLQANHTNLDQVLDVGVHEGHKVQLVFVRGREVQPPIPEVQVIEPGQGIGECLPYY